MGILSSIFGTGDVISKGIDLIDSLHTSTEEEIAAKSKAKADLLTAYAPFKLAQRYLAFMFTGAFLISFFVVLVMTLAGMTSIDEVRAVLSEFYIGEITFTIIGFYFGSGFVEGAISKVKNK